MRVPVFSHPCQHLLSAFLFTAILVAMFLRLAVFLFVCLSSFVFHIYAHMYKFIYKYMYLYVFMYVYPHIAQMDLRHLSWICFSFSIFLFVISHCVVESLGSSVSTPWCYLCTSFGPSCSNRACICVHTGGGHLAFHLQPTSHPLQGCCFCRQSMWVNSEISPPLPGGRERPPAQSLPF